MASVMNTGTCLRPSCTAIVCPSISGMIVDRRDHVLMTFLVPFSFWATTFFRRCSSTKGPLLILRGIVDYLSPSCSRCVAERSSGFLPSSSAGSGPQAYRWGSPGAYHQRSYPHHHHAGGQPGSLRH